MDTEEFYKGIAVGLKKMTEYLEYEQNLPLMETQFSQDIKKLGYDKLNIISILTKAVSLNS